jgi:hypothetical protein
MKTLTSIVALAAALFVVGCGGSNPSVQEGVAYLRAIHASPNAGTVVALYQTDLGDESLGYGLSLPEVGQAPAAIGTRTHTVSFRTQGSLPQTFTESINVQRDRYYHAIFAGLVASTGADAPRVIVTSDRAADLTSTQINLRFVHASPTIPGAVDVYAVPAEGSIAQATPIVSNLAKYHASPLIKLNPGTYRLVITATGLKAPLVERTTTSVAGDYGVGVVLDALGGDGLSLTLFGSNLTGGPQT